MTPDRAPNVQQLLAFYLEAGVDCALTETPVDRLADPGKLVALHEAPQPNPVRVTPAALPPARGEAALAPEAAIMSAREAARTAPSLEALRDLLEKFDGCALKFTATRLVFADGNPGARVMFVGEAPGREEDIEGLPFVGRSGKLLDRMMAAIGLDRAKAYIANVIPWRPPGNRTPTPQETQICLPIRPICCVRRPTSASPGRICAPSPRRWSRRIPPRPEVRRGRLRRAPRSMSEQCRQPSAGRATISLSIVAPARVAAIGPERFRSADRAEPTRSSR
jgi:hypothetical protein